MLIFNQRELEVRRRLLRRTSNLSEQLLWQQLRNSKFEIRFRRQFSVGFYILDFYAPKARLAIEIDGGIHELQHEYDQHRQSEIESLGISFLRFSDYEVLFEIENVLEKIRSRIPLLTKERDKG